MAGAWERRRGGDPKSVNKIKGTCKSTGRTVKYFQERGRAYAMNMDCA